MMKAILSNLLLFMPFILFAQEKSQPLETRVQRVIVFMNGAQVERSGQVSIPAGNSEIVFKGLSPEIEEQSIQVKGTGNFTILSVNRQADFLRAQQLNESLSAMRNQIQGMKDDREIQENIISILKKEEDMLASNQSVGNGGAGLDLNRLKQALDFQKSRLTENKVKQLSTQKEINRLNREIRKLENQLAEEAGRPGNRTSNIVLRLSAKTAVNGKFDLSYVVKNASWYPSYDIRAIDVNKPISLIYRANVSQQSGEDWKNVKLVLSSGDPSIGGSKPSLRPYQIGYNISRYPTTANITSVRGRITDAQDNSPLAGVTIRVKGSSIASVSDQNGNYTIQIPSMNATLQFTYVGYELQERAASFAEQNVQLSPSANKLEELKIANIDQALQGKLAGISIRGQSSLKKSSVPLDVAVQENQTNVQFEVAQPYSMVSDGKLLTVEIAEHELNADYRYYAVPKLSQEAYLSASITGIADLNLLSGEASIFFDGAYLGKTLLNAENTSDTLSVPLGADKSLVVKRVQQKEQNERSVIGANQKATRAFDIEILSRKAMPVRLIVEDQLPVSNTSEVNVDKQELSGALVDEASGMLKWDLEIKPQEKKTLKLRYQVKYPKGKPLSLE